MIATAPARSGDDVLAETVEKILAAWEAAFPEGGLSGYTSREELLKGWRASTFRQEVIAFLLDAPEPTARELRRYLRAPKALFDALSTPPRAELWRWTYQPEGDRGRVLKFQEASAACDEVYHLKREKSINWADAVEQIARKYQVSSHTLERLLRERRQVRAIERALRSERSRSKPKNSH